MENLAQEISNLSLENQKNNQQNNTQNIITGVLYDKRMLDHKSKRQHVENPSRLIQILYNLNQKNLINEDSDKQNQRNEQNVNKIILQQKCMKAERQFILQAHNEKYVNFVDNIWPKNYSKPNIYMLDTYACESSTEVAYLAAGATIEAINKVYNKEWTNSFAIVRPPGHHSGHSNTPTGFCYFNNVVIGAKYAINNLGLKKVAIIDWDIHHGDGSQKLLEDDPNILQISLHRHDNGDFYPGICGSANNIGVGKGEGFNLNFPWNLDLKSQQTARNQEYIFIFERLIMPILQEFQPEFILVSSGFDGCMGDPLGQCEVTQDGYAYMTHRLMKFMNNKIVVNLEGGYNLDEIPKAAEGVLRALNGEYLPITNTLDNKTLEQVISECTPNKVGLDTYKICLEKFKDYWPCLLENKEALQFEQNCFNNIKNSYRFLNQQQVDFVNNDEQILFNFKDESEYDTQIFNYFTNSKFKQIDEQYQQLFLNISEINNNNNQQQVLFQNIFQKRENASILRLNFGNNKNLMKQLTPYWKKNSFKIENCVVKDSYGVPQYIRVWNQLSQYQKYPLNKLILEYFSIQEDQQKQIKNNIGCQLLIEFLEKLEAFIQKQDTEISRCEIICLYDSQNPQNSTFKILALNELQKNQEQQNSYLNVLKGVQNFQQQLKEIILKSQQVEKKPSSSKKKK